MEETLEEAAEFWDAKQTILEFGKSYSSTDRPFAKAFIEGAEWQAERMYSEEEVGELVYNTIGEYGKHYGIMIDGAKLNELFEQFKKKQYSKKNLDVTHYRNGNPIPFVEDNEEWSKLHITRCIRKFAITMKLSDHDNRTIKREKTYHI